MAIAGKFPGASSELTSELTLPISLDPCVAILYLLDADVNRSEISLRYSRASAEHVFASVLSNSNTGAGSMEVSVGHLASNTCW